MTCNIVVRNYLMVKLEGKLTCVRFISPCNVIVLVLEGKLKCIRLPSWWNVFNDNEFVPVENITHVFFLCSTTIRKFLSTKLHVNEI